MLFFCVFLNNFLKFKCMPVLFISWEKKKVKTTFARRRHAWSWKYPVFTPLSNPSRFHERLPFISDHFFENNISLKNTHWIYISTVFIKKKIYFLNPNNLFIQTCTVLLFYDVCFPTMKLMLSNCINIKESVGNYFI